MEWRNVLFNDTLTHFIYSISYMTSDMVKHHSDLIEETHCPHMGYNFQLAASIIL